MQRIAAHLDGCRECAGEWAALQQKQASLAALGPVPEPEDLVAAHSRCGKPGAGAQPQERLRGLEPGLEEYRRTVSAAGRRGFASAVSAAGHGHCAGGHVYPA